MLLTRTTLFLNNPQLLTIQYAKTVPPTTEKITFYYNKNSYQRKRFLNLQLSTNLVFSNTDLFQYFSTFFFITAP